MSIDGMPNEVVFEPLNEFNAQGASGRKQASEPGRITTAMPGNIVEVLVKVGDKRESRAGGADYRSHENGNGSACQCCGHSEGGACGQRRSRYAWRNIGGNCVTAQRLAPCK